MASPPILAVGAVYLPTLVEAVYRLTLAAKRDQRLNRVEAEGTWII